MSKIINMTEQSYTELRNEFEEALKDLKISDGKFCFTKIFGNTEKKAKLYFTEKAYLKMVALVKKFDKEVGWHGIAKRSDNEENAYVISDIMVYPQEVTGSTVNTDQNEYQNWMYNFDDETFNNIRMHGHSHVNMGTTPSSVDLAHYDGILAQLDKTMFYIFLIWNKRGEKTIKIYDLSKNTLFETEDITVCVLNDGPGIEKFLKDSKELVKDKTYPKWDYGYGYKGFINQDTKDAKSSKTDKKTSNDDPAIGTSGGVHVSGNKKKKKTSIYNDDYIIGGIPDWRGRYGFYDYE